MGGKGLLRSSSCQIRWNRAGRGERAAEGERRGHRSLDLSCRSKLCLLSEVLLLLLLWAEPQGSILQGVALNIQEAPGSASAKEQISLNFIQTKRKPLYLFSWTYSRIIHSTSELSTSELVIAQPFGQPEFKAREYIGLEDQQHANVYKPGKYELLDLPYRTGVYCTQFIYF